VLPKCALSQPRDKLDGGKTYSFLKKSAALFRVSGCLAFATTAERASTFNTSTYRKAKYLQHHPLRKTRVHSRSPLCYHISPNCPIPNDLSVGSRKAGEVRCALLESFHGWILSSHHSRNCACGVDSECNFALTVATLPKHLANFL
jgi:hypothetical protein